MTSINAGGAFYRVQAALDQNATRVADSMQRLATGKQNISPGDNAGTVALSTGLRAELASLQVGQRNATEALNALEMATTDIQTLSDLVIRLEELNSLGENALNSAIDRLAIKAEAKAIIEEFDLVQKRSLWKGNSMFDQGTALAISFGRNNGNLQVKGLGHGSSVGVGVANNLTVGSLVVFGRAAQKRTIAVVGVADSFVTKPDSLTGIGASVTASLIALGTADSNAGSIGMRNSTGLGGLARLVDEKRINAANIYNQVENTMDHLSNLKAGLSLDLAAKTDVDFAAETTELAKGQILAQAGTAMLAQANAQGQSMLALIQS